MNLSKVLLIALLGFAIMACSGNNQDNVTNTQQPGYNPPTAAPQPINPPVAATGAVQHYICPNNCAGSGAGQAGSCPTCGSQYIHNAAYHNQPGATPTNPGNTQLFQPGQAPPTVPTPTSPETAAQNAAGVWHYTCSNGCAGGSGTKGNCASCGATLAHNAAYHNN